MPPVYAGQRNANSIYFTPIIYRQPDTVDMIPLRIPRPDDRDVAIDPEFQELPLRSQRQASKLLNWREYHLQKLERARFVRNVLGGAALGAGITYAALMIDQFPEWNTEFYPAEAIVAAGAIYNTVRAHQEKTSARVLAAAIKSQFIVSAIEPPGWIEQ